MPEEEEAADQSTSIWNAIRRWISGGVMASIIASVIFTFFLQPVATRFSKILLSIIGAFSQKIVDQIYQQAALGPSNLPIMLLVIGESAVILVVFFSYIKIRIYGLFGGNTIQQQSKKNPAKKSTYWIIFDLAVPTINSFLIIFLVGSIFIGIQLDATFHQRLNVLLPVITDQQQKLFIQKWALMRSRSDYENIMKNMENMASSKDVRLPDRLI